MDNMSVFIIGAILSLIIVVAIVFYHYRKRNLEKLFNQVYETAKQIPKQKKNSFLLLMFKNSLSSKKKSNKTSIANKLKNPKYLEVQLVQMSRILKDNSKTQDKTIKKALQLLKTYKRWEKDKINKNKKETPTKE